MADGIRIDALDSTALPSLSHELPAMKDGLTVKLTVAQLRDVMLGGADNLALALKDLSNTVGPRGKLSKLMLVGDDYDLLLENGLWAFPSGAVNAPEATRAYVVRCETDDSGSYITQFARGVTADSSANSYVYKRERNAGVWGAWYRVRENEDELLLYSQSNADGRDVLLNASTLGATLAKIADAAAGRAAISAPPMPQSAVGVGQWEAIHATVGNGLVLPAGGTWKWFGIGYHNSSLTIMTVFNAGISAGGSIVMTGAASTVYTGAAWRIS